MKSIFIDDYDIDYEFRSYQRVNSTGKLINVKQAAYKNWRLIESASHATLEKLNEITANIFSIIKDYVDLASKSGMTEAWFINDSSEAFRCFYDKFSNNLSCLGISKEELIELCTKDPNMKGLIATVEDANTIKGLIKKKCQLQYRHALTVDAFRHAVELRLASYLKNHNKDTFDHMFTIKNFEREYVVEYNANLMNFNWKPRSISVHAS